jgi:hypothetical protein
MKTSIRDLQKGDWISYGKKILILVSEPEMIGFTKDEYSEPIYRVAGSTHNDENIVIEGITSNKYQVL